MLSSELEAVEFLNGHDAVAMSQLLKRRQDTEVEQYSITPLFVLELVTFISLFESSQFCFPHF